MKKGSLKSSFEAAFKGIGLLFSTERNARIHLVAIPVVVCCGMLLKVSVFEWCIFLILFALVISLEAVNSAIERICDLYSTEQNPKIKAIKDISSGAVLWSVILAVIIAVVIFVPKIISLVS